MDYETAVQQADYALAAILGQGGTYTFEDTNKIAIAFGEWLTEHTDVLAALDTVAQIEPFSVEDYIGAHSRTYKIFTPDEPSPEMLPSGADDGVVILPRSA